MTRQRHAIPTGLAVEDRFIAYGAYSLSVRQFLVLVAGVALAYGLWKGHPGLPLPLRAAVAVAVLAVAVVGALARPDGQSLERWAFLLAHYRRTCAPALWRPLPSRHDAQSSGEAALVGLTPTRRWGDVGTRASGEEWSGEVGR